MIDWIKNNSWAIVVLLGTMVVSYTLYGARVQALESKASEQADKIEAARLTDVQTQITLAKMQKDIEYIKLKIDRIAQ